MSDANAAVRVVRPEDRVPFVRTAGDAYRYLATGRSDGWDLLHDGSPGPPWRRPRAPTFKPARKRASTCSRGP